ncbi:unnamed protein product [Adineta steineri]|uniref:Mitochondrial transcription rescue factor 1 C-terminal domain-containing protein n=1 Tax=Adineta steineri TaxID=433720 RepID=A0A813MDM5_9BILA|nr:unnamed protein product [Adineta steineri]CAF3705751.1 unnamed protein product [Adineta steineri]
MSTFRLISTLRSSLLTIKSYQRLLLPSSQLLFRSTSSHILKPTIQQTCLFSSSAVCHGRRRDKIDGSLTEEVNNEEEEEDNDNDDDSGIDQNEEEKIRTSIQQYKIPKGYRIIIRHIASLRLDIICSAGTGMGRSTIEDEFYGSKLRVNGEKSTKKAQQIKEGDVIDLVTTRIEGAKYNSKRIIVYKVFDEKSIKNKVKVCLIAWRQGVEVDGSQWS